MMGFLAMAILDQINRQTPDDEAASSVINLRREKQFRDEDKALRVIHNGGTYRTAEGARRMQMRADAYKRDSAAAKKKAKQS